MRARDIIIIVVARVDRVSSLAGSIGTPRDARARSKDEGWIGSIFTRGRVARGRRDATLAVARARSRSTSIGAAIDRDRSNHRRARASAARASRRGIERGIERARLTNEIFFETNSAFVAPKAAVAATAAAVLLAGPAHAEKLGLVVENGTGMAPGKYEQPLYDPRPVVTVQTDGPGDVTREEARVLPNRQVGPAGCKAH